MHQLRVRRRLTHTSLLGILIILAILIHLLRVTCIDSSLNPRVDVTLSSIHHGTHPQRAVVLTKVCKH